MNGRAALRKLAKRYAELERRRLELQSLSGEGQRLSKQAIFALHRKDTGKAKKLLDAATARLRTAGRIVSKEPKLASEGMWRSALEEYVEACLFGRAVDGRPLFPAQDVTDDPTITLGALSDLVGEYVRLAVNAATEGDRKRVERIVDDARTIVEYLSSLDATGSLRSKGDQARQHLRKLEDIRYDITIRSV
jgi:predicted translin family RNA/ssDNA-binding protein